MTEFFQYLLTPFQYFSQFGLGAMLASALAGVISFTGTVSNLLGTNVTGPNSPPEVLTVTVATTPNATGPSVGEITVDASGTTVYVSGSVQDADGCADISSAASVNVTMFPQQFGSCASAAGYCLSIPTSASATNISGCDDGTTVGYITSMTLQPIPIPEGALQTLTATYTVQATVTDRQGAFDSGETQVQITHPGTTASALPLPSFIPSPASVSSAVSPIPIGTSGSLRPALSSLNAGVIAPSATPLVLPTPLSASTVTSPTPLPAAFSSPPTAFVMANTPSPEMATFQTTFSAVKSESTPGVLGIDTTRKKPRTFCTWLFWWLFCVRY